MNTQAGTKPLTVLSLRGLFLDPFSLYYINDLPDEVKYGTYGYLFADDMKAFQGIQTLDDCIKLQQDCDVI